MMEHKIMLLVRVNVFNSTHPTKRNFSIIICFMLFAEWLPDSLIMLKNLILLYLIRCLDELSVILHPNLRKSRLKETTINKTSNIRR